MSFLDKLFSGTIATDLATAGGDPVNVSSAAPPSGAGKIPVTIDATHIEWQDVPGGGAGLPMIPGVVGPPEPNTWSIVDGSEGILLPLVEGPGVTCGMYTLAPVNVSAQGEGNVLFWRGEMVEAGDWVTLPANCYAEWTAVSLGGPNLAWIPRGASNEAPEPEPPSGGGLVYGGNTSAPEPGQWVMVDDADAYLPSGASVGDTVGMFVNPNRDGATLHIASGSFMIGNQLLDSGDTFALRGGAYYEWTLEPWGEGNRWFPRGMSNERPAALVFRGSGTVAPNEWVASSNYGDVVWFPAGAQHGDSFAVFVDSEGATLIPGTGYGLYSPDGTNLVGGTGEINVPGTCYYEWIFDASEDVWRPRQNILQLRPDAVASAIRDDTTTSVFSVGDKQIADVLEPTDPNHAATKAYVDAAIAAAIAALGP